MDKKGQILLDYYESFLKKWGLNNKKRNMRRVKMLDDWKKKIMEEK